MILIEFLKKQINKIFGVFGLKISRVRHKDILSFGGRQWDFGKIKILSLEPDLIVDVGVANGTPELYQAFPRGRLCLIEPNKDFNIGIKRTIGNRPYILINKAAGNMQGKVKLHHNPKKSHQSSLYKRTVVGT